MGTGADPAVRRGQDQPAAEGLGYVTHKHRIRSTFLAFCKVCVLFEPDLPVTGQQKMQCSIYWHYDVKADRYAAVLKVFYVLLGVIFS